MSLVTGNEIRETQVLRDETTYLWIYHAQKSGIPRKITIPNIVGASLSEDVMVEKELGGNLEAVQESCRDRQARLVTTHLPGVTM